MYPVSFILGSFKKYNRKLTPFTAGITRGGYYKDNSIRCTLKDV
jgi:hypothetical protein